MTQRKVSLQVRPEIINAMKLSAAAVVGAHRLGNRIYLAVRRKK